jgi:IclR family transcriptional regulator, KDG regulon repressor
MHKAKENIKGDTNQHDRLEERNLVISNNLSDTNEGPIDMVQVHRAAKIITCISNGINSLTNIADYCKMSKSATHRMVKALEKSRFIAYNPNNRKYILGDLIVGIAARPNISHEYLIINSNLEMEGLTKITEETINLTILSGLGQVSVRTIQSKNKLRVVEDENITAFSFGGAISHVLLSQVSDNELEMFLRNIRIEGNNGSFTNKEVLESRIKNAKLQGYDISTGEKIIGSICISAPIRNYVLPATINILGPEFRMKDRCPSFTKLLVDAANRISYNLINSVIE